MWQRKWVPCSTPLKIQRVQSDSLGIDQGLCFVVENRGCLAVMSTAASIDMILNGLEHHNIPLSLSHLRRVGWQQRHLQRHALISTTHQAFIQLQIPISGSISAFSLHLARVCRCCSVRAKIIGDARAAQAARAGTAHRHRLRVKQKLMHKGNSIVPRPTEICKWR